MSTQNETEPPSPQSPQSWTGPRVGDPAALLAGCLPHGVVTPANSPLVSLSLLSSAGHSMLSRYLSPIVSFPQSYQRRLTPIVFFTRRYEDLVC